MYEPQTRRQPQSQAQSQPFPLRHSTPNHRNAVTVIILYSILMFFVAAWSGFFGYYWARQRVLAGAVFPTTIGELSGAVAEGADALPIAPEVIANVGEESAGDHEALAPLSILLLGSDERENEFEFNTDTIILLTLNPQTKQAGMLSFSRDLYVDVPTLGEKAKINTIYGLGEARGYSGGGAQLLVDTVSSMIGRPIPYYVRINFDSFIQIVDMIGGIDINVPKTIHDEEYPTANYGVEVFHLEAGLQRLDGATALKYARTRHADDDYGRQRRQQDVIRAVVDKVRRADMIPTLIKNLPSLFSQMSTSVETNLNMVGDFFTLSAYANFISQNDLQGVQQEVIDKRYGQEDYNGIGQWILIPKPSEVRVAVNRYFGKLNTLASEAAELDASWVRIEILNGTDTPGVAARTRDLLRQRGWNVVSINDADRDDYTQTLVVSYGAPEAIVQKINNDLQLQVNFNNLSGLSRNTPVDLKIVVGKDMLSNLGMGTQ